MTSTVSSQLAVSLPVVVDLGGSQARGVTQELGLDRISFLTDCVSSPGASVTVVLCYSQNVAYMPLSGRVTAVTEIEGDSPTRFRIDIALDALGQTIRLVLESALQELETYLQTSIVAQCPRCGAFHLDAAAAPPGYRFRCRACAFDWGWQPGEPWPAVQVNPRRRQPGTDNAPQP